MADHGRVWPNLRNDGSGLSIPELTTRQLRRGRVILLTRKGPREWEIIQTKPDRERDSSDKHPRLAYSENYAQVAIEGRDFDRIADANDANRPFFIIGDFSEDELSGLISFVRQDASIPIPARALPTDTLPILSVVRKQDGAVKVCFRKGPLHWVFVDLQRQDKGWVFVKSITAQA